MSIQILEQPGSLGTQIGAGFGKGLAESLPKGIAQGRLSASLKNLEGKNLNPLQQISHLIGQGGADPEMAGQLLPYIQQAQARQQFLGNESSPLPSPTAGGQGGQPTTQAQITSPQSLARRLWSQNPTMFNTISEAENYATNKISNADKEFDRVTSTFLQKSGNETFKDIVGELEESYRNRLKNSINLRGDEVAEANKIADEMLSFAKVRGDLRTNLDKNFLTLPHEKMLRSLEKLRGDYEKKGQLHNFANDLIAGGMSGNFARTFSQPLDRDPGLRKYLDSIPTTSSFKSMIPSHGMSKKAVKASEIKQKGADQIHKNILDRISPNVSLSSIGLDLMSKGYNPDAFLAYANDHQEKLSKRQIEELGNTDPWHPNLDDIFILDGKKGVPAWFKRLRTVGKG